MRKDLPTLKTTVNKIIGICFLANSFSGLQSQIITTVAGNGATAFAGDGGAAISASLYNPPGVAADVSGNIYIADYYNQCLRKVNPAGIISTLAGTGGTVGFSGDGGLATAARLNRPSGVAIDAAGNIFIADMMNQRIRKISTSGTITTVAGNGTQGYSGDGGLATAAKLNQPTGVAVDGAGNIYIADNNNSCIRKVNTSGTITTVAGTGTLGFSGDGGAANVAQLSQPFGVAVDGSGNIYISDTGNDRIRMVNTSGTITTIGGNGTVGFTGDGGLATSAQLYNPRGIAVDGAGNIYFSDSFNERIRKISTTGTITTIAGSGTIGFGGDGGVPTSALLYYPDGVAVDFSGNNIFIADNSNNRIRRVNLLTGINELSNSNEIKIYPIPCNENVNVSLNGNGFSSLKIHDVLGREIYSQRLNEAQQDLNLKIDLTDLSNGIYIMQISSAKGMISKRIEVQK